MLINKVLWCQGNLIRQTEVNSWKVLLPSEWQPFTICDEEPCNISQSIVSIPRYRGGREILRYNWPVKKAAWPFAGQLARGARSRPKSYGWLNRRALESFMPIRMPACLRN